MFVCCHLSVQYVYVMCFSQVCMTYYFASQIRQGKQNRNDYKVYINSTRSTSLLSVTRESIRRQEQHEKREKNTKIYNTTF
jgi:hypothetical protein